MEDKWAYDYTDEELLTRLLRATQEASVSSSGLVIDAMAGHHAEEFVYWRGVMQARLQGVRPPVARGTQMRLIDGHMAHPSDYRGITMYRGNKEVRKVHRIYYNGRGHWFLSFERGGDHYRAEDFETVPQEALRSA